MNGSSISVIMPALNEERHLAASIAAVRAAYDDLCPYEIIVVDDGSTDRTGAIADDFTAADPRIRVVHHAINQGLGAAFAAGVALAIGDYAMLVPADDETPVATIRRIGEQAGQADLVITYTTNPEVRRLHRRVISRAYTGLVNRLMGLRLRYYNGNTLIRTRLLRSIPLDSRGHGYMAAILVRLIARGSSYVEIGIELQARSGQKSKALRPKNVASVARTLGALSWEVRVRPARAWVPIPAPADDPSAD